MRLKVSSAIIVLYSVWATAAYCQGIVRGTVYDRESRKPVPGVYVLFGKGSGTVSDSSGKYTITSDSSRLVITFQSVGYITLRKEAYLRSGQTIILDAELESSVQLLDQVVVSADRIEHRLSDLTITVNIIKQDFISRHHITDIQELATKIPGIDVLDGQASIRGGSGFSYGVGSRVLALVDGLPLLSADAGGIRWQYLPVENLSQVEIIKGASSVLYGSSALNGIISLRTADASNIPSTSFFAEGGLYLRPARDEWKWWSSPRVFSTVSMSHLRKAGNTDIGLSMNLFTDNSYRKYNDEKLGKVSLRIKHADKKTDGLSYGINLTAGLTAKTDFLLWESADSALVQDTSSVSYLHGRYFAADPFISFSRRERFRHDLRMRIQSSENIFPVKSQNNARTLSGYGEYQLWIKPWDIISITAGSSATWNRINSNFFGDHIGINIAVFGQGEIQILERLKAVAGLRIEENILDKEYDEPVPVFRTGINWQAAEYTFFRASFGQGYRFPSIAEKYASTTLGSVTIFPNPYVEAESGWSSEAGIKQGVRLGQITGQADLSLFFSRNKDLIEYIFGVYPEGLGFQATNVEQSRIYGAETEIYLEKRSGRFSSTLTAGYTFIYPVEFNSLTRKNTDIYLKYRRMHSGKISIDNQYKRITTSLGIYAKSKILNIDDVFLSPLTRETILPGFYDYWMNHNRGYILFDLSAGYRLTDILTVSFLIRNVTNTEYMGRPADIQPPRNISLRLTGRINK
jgi:iron complex outermembrane receptor protein